MSPVTPIFTKIDINFIATGGHPVDVLSSYVTRLKRELLSNIRTTDMAVFGNRLGKYVTAVTICLFNVKCGGGGEILLNFWFRHVKSGMVMDRKC